MTRREMLGSLNPLLYCASGPSYIAINIRGSKLVQMPDNTQRFVCLGEILWNHYSILVRHGNFYGSAAAIASDGGKSIVLPPEESMAIVSLITDLHEYIRECERRFD